MVTRVYIRPVIQIVGSALTIHVLFVQICLDRYIAIVTFQKCSANDIHDPRLTQFECGGEVCNIKFSSFTIGLIEYVLLIYTKGCRFTSTGKIFQF